MIGFEGDRGRRMSVGKYTLWNSMTLITYAPKTLFCFDGALVVGDRALP
jgi:hypothetical protein